MSLHGELHRELVEDLLAEAANNHGDRILLTDPALLEVEDLLLADLRGRRLVLDLRGQIVSSGTFPSYEDFVFDQLGATEEEMTLAIAEVELMTGNSLTDADLTGAVIFARLDEALGKVDIRELLPPSFEPAGSDPTVPLLSEGGMVTLVGCFLLTAFVMARARRASGTL